MPSSRKFYRTVITVEVLSDLPLPDGLSLEAISNAIEQGDCSGRVITLLDNEPVDGFIMANLLQAQGSDPEFFGLTPEGEDIEREE